MASIYTLHYDNETDGTAVPTDGSAFGTGDAFDAGGWNGTGASCVVDDGDDYGPFEYHDFTGRTNVIVYDQGASGSSVGRRHDMTNEEYVGELIPFMVSKGSGLAANAFLYQYFSGASNAVEVRLTTAGQIQIRIREIAFSTGSQVLSADTQYWMSIYLRGHASLGFAEVKLYDANMNLLDTIGNQTGNQNTVGTIGHRRQGVVFGGEANFQFAVGEIFTDDGGHPTLPTPTSGTVTDADIEWRLTVNSGSAGDSTAQPDPNASLGGYCSTTVISETLNGLFDDVSGAENAALDVEYRCVYIANKSDTTWSNVKVWIESETVNSPTHAIALDGVGVTALTSASAQTEIETDEGTAPTGETFTSPTTKAGGLSVASVAATSGFGLWIRRTAVDSGAEPNATLTLRVEGDSGVGG